MGGDMCGVYKTADHGKNWHMSNAGLTHYGLYDTVVAKE